MYDNPAFLIFIGRIYHLIASCLYINKQKFSWQISMRDNSLCIQLPWIIMLVITIKNEKLHDETQRKMKKRRVENIHSKHSRVHNWYIISHFILLTNIVLNEECPNHCFGPFLPLARLSSFYLSCLCSHIWDSPMEQKISIPIRWEIKFTHTYTLIRMKKYSANICSTNFIIFSYRIYNL